MAHQHKATGAIIIIIVIIIIIPIYAPYHC